MELISLQVYPPLYFRNFSAVTEFQKYALAEVTEFGDIPPGMERFTLPAGLYAVFHYRGLASDPTIFQQIFTQWLPASQYALDARPHFEVLGEKYKNDDPASEEDIWIPIAKRE